jgi:tetratricopeptide (TPR) repeat protein
MLLAQLLLASACGTLPHPPADVPVEDRTVRQAPGGPAVPDRLPEQEAPPAAAGQVEAGAAATERIPVIVALLDESDRRLRSGHAEDAAVALERAIRLAPDDPLPWHRLAALRLAQRQWDQAAALAQKSNSLAGNDPQLQAANWRIMARTRAEQGDQAGAVRAAAEAERLSTLRD